jgi:hypothetical protein
LFSRAWRPTADILVAILAVILGVTPCSIVLMFGGLQVVAECNPGVMRGLFVIARFVVLGRFTMMFGGLLIVLGRVLVKLVDLMLRHFVLPELSLLAPKPTTR